MGNGNSIRARRRARGKDKQWWREGPKIKKRTIPLIQYQELPKRNVNFDEFLTFSQEKIADSLGVKEEMIDYYKKSKLKNYLRGIYIKDKSWVWVHRG